MRRLQPGDAEALAAFYNAIPTDERRFFKPCDYPMGVGDARGIVEELARGGREDVVAVHASQVVGWGFLRRTEWCEPNELSLGIAVSPGVRRKGVADRIMGALDDRACERHLASVRLIVVRENEKAIALYRKHGFEQTGEFVSGEHYFVMRKAL
ncbi:MAG: GNAT family N-acetyltransferase [Planctomycetota bacterium]